jgi:glycosyltransferase involved in cell wall biosynthesis
MKKLKILWFAPYPVSRLQPFPGGCAPFRSEHPAPWVVNLSEAVAANHPDIELHIAVINENARRSFSIQRNGIHYHVVKLRYDLPFGKHWPPFQWDVVTKYRRARARLCQLAAAVKPDLIHAFGTEYLYAVAAKDSNLPYLVYMQGIVHKLIEAMPGNKWFRFKLSLEKEVLEHCRYYVAETAFGEKFVRETVPAATVWRVANSVTPAYFDVQHEAKMHGRLLFVGNILHGKGVNELLAAVDQNGWELTMVGGNGSSYAQALMEQYRHNPAIRWTGRIPVAEVTALMKKHDAFVLPSYMDTSPYALAEAMAAGLPVVASRVGGIPDMVTDGETGILVEPKSVESLVQGIKRLYADPEKMLRMGAEARRVALERFLPARNARILVEAYQQVLNERDGRKL